MRQRLAGGARREERRGRQSVSDRSELNARKCRAAGSASAVRDARVTAVDPVCVLVPYSV